MNIAKMEQQEEAQALADREYWRQYEHSGWLLHGFTERDTASFFNPKTGRTVQVVGQFLEGLLRRNK